MKNWRTTASATGAALMSLLTIISIAPYELEGIGTLMPPKYKAMIAIASAVAALILKVLNGAQQKDAKDASKPALSSSSAVTDPAPTM